MSHIYFSIVLNIHNLEMKTIQPRTYRKLHFEPCLLRSLSHTPINNQFEPSPFLQLLYIQRLYKSHAFLLCRPQAIIMLFTPCLSYLLVRRSPSAVPTELPPLFTQGRFGLWRQTTKYSSLKSFFLPQRG